jgi:hypothetical protein
MKKEETVAAVFWWITENTPLVIQLLFALIPVLALLLAALTIYAVFWKGRGK